MGLSTPTSASGLIFVARAVATSLPAIPDFAYRRVDPWFGYRSRPRGVFVSSQPDRCLARESINVARRPLKPPLSLRRREAARLHFRHQVREPLLRDHPGGSKHANLPPREVYDGRSLAAARLAPNGEVHGNTNHRVHAFEGPWRGLSGEVGARRVQRLPVAREHRPGYGMRRHPHADGSVLGIEHQGERARPEALSQQTSERRNLSGPLESLLRRATEVGYGFGSIAALDLEQ